MRLEAAFISDISYLFGQVNFSLIRETSRHFVKSYACGNYVATLKVDRSHGTYQKGKSGNICHRPQQSHKGKCVRRILKGERALFFYCLRNNKRELKQRYLY